jgi:hypothetical protein
MISSPAAADAPTVVSRFEIVEDTIYAMDGLLLATDAEA